MKSFIKRTLYRLVPLQVLHYRAYCQLIKNPNSYLYSTGWMQSLKELKPIDKNGNPIPWMNIPTIGFLEERLTHDLNLFEFGSGYSTCFFARLVRNVTSVEGDEKWLYIIKPLVPDYVKLIFKEEDIDGDYCRTIGSTREKYDVVIVDGRDRVNCIKQSILILSSKGVILLDDSMRDEYKEGIDFAKENGFNTLNMEGLLPMSGVQASATIFYRKENCLMI
jgi:hypothetical protein